MSHPIFVCHNLAKSLQNPGHVEKVTLDSMRLVEGPSSLWQDASFADGFAGISYFYSAMEKAFPGENFGHYALEHLREALHRFRKTSSVNGSLFKGLSGISLAIASLPNPTDQILKFQEGLDDWIAEEVDKYLAFIPYYRSEDTLIPPFYYAFCPGLSGILSFLIGRKDNPHLQQLAKKCAEELAQLMLTKKRVGSQQVEAWYYADDLLAKEYRGPTASSGYNTSLFFGATGCLIALSSALLEGIRSDTIYKAVDHMSSWFKQLYTPFLQEGNWNSIASVEGLLLPPISEISHIQSSWLMGWPPLFKALHLSGKALRSPAIQQFSTDFSLKCLESRPEFYLNGTSFCMGMAGYCSTLYSLAKESGNRILMESVRSVAKSCTDAFDARLSFGFPQFGLGRDGLPVQVESATFGSGAAGIGLALLTIEDKYECSLL